jgi:hypothetical protein
MTLFDQGGAGLDPIYVRLRDTDDPADAEQKAYLDGLWARVRPHLDENFKSAFARHANQRFWELRLAAAFLDLGYGLDAGGEGRPDLATRLQAGERLWEWDAGDRCSEVSQRQIRGAAASSLPSESDHVLNT